MPFAVELSGLLGAFVMLVGVWGVLAPSRMVDFVKRFGSKGGLVFAVVVRVIVGLALWFAAPSSRAPLLLQVLAVLAIVAAVALPLMGLERFKALLLWWTKLSPAKQRLNSLVAVAFGAAILWALLPAAT